jgi:hypothetical protein
MSAEAIHYQKNPTLRIDEEAIFVLVPHPPHVGVAANH